MGFRYSANRCVQRTCSGGGAEGVGAHDLAELTGSWARGCPGGGQGHIRAHDDLRRGHDSGHERPGFRRVGVEVDPPSHQPPGEVRVGVFFGDPVAVDAVEGLGGEDGVVVVVGA